MREVIEQLRILLCEFLLGIVVLIAPSKNEEGKTIIKMIQMYCKYKQKELQDED